MIDQIAVFLGGRAAEMIVFNEQTAGASNDIDRATRLARAMVVEYGMSELGPMNFAPEYETANYGKAWGEPSKISDKLQEKVDAEVQRLIKEGQQRALDLLNKYRTELTDVSEKLLEIESLDADDFESLMGMKKSRVEDAPVKIFKTKKIK